MNKAELLRCLSETHAASLELLRDLDPELVVYEESGWRVKDIVAHVTTWDAETVRSFHAHRRGGDYSIEAYDNADSFNGFVARVRQFEPMDTILADWESVRRWMDIIFNAMSEAEYDDEMTSPSGERGIARELIEEICTHEAEHMADIRAKLTSHP